MKIAVCLKQVISPDAPLTLDEARGWIRETELPRETNEPDLHALELALSLRDRHQGEVTAVTVGPESAVATLRDALARGADHAVHIVDADAFAREPLQTARALANILRAERHDLVLAGSQSTDFGHGQTGVLLAELLGLPHVSMVVEAALEGDNNLRARRELEAGANQWWKTSLPGVLTVQSGINRPRYAGVKGIMAAKKRPIRSVTFAEAHAGPPAASVTCEAMATPAARANTTLLTGAAPDVAAQLAERLRAALGR
ncbi:MAG TPA: electron transfer flavoprotein subunit beta/FixA family protein [Sulfuricaulis sp.]|nr:electron transfer flavoprotein subunit beta/FixA family protein [Sulfuricaulis sp.]